MTGFLPEKPGVAKGPVPRFAGISKRFKNRFIPLANINPIQTRRLSQVIDDLAVNPVVFASVPTALAVLNKVGVSLLNRIGRPTKLKTVRSFK